MAGADVLARSHAGAVQLSDLLDAGAGVNVAANAAAPLAQWALDAYARGVFAPRGRGPERFDCMGLALWAQPFVGRAAASYLDLYEALDIHVTRDVDKLVRVEAESWKRAAGDVGDVLVLGSGKRVHHVAVLCGAGRAIHALEGAGIVIQKIDGRRDVRRFADMRVFGCVAPA